MQILFEQPMFPGRITWRQTSNGARAANGKVDKSTKGKGMICIFSSFPGWGLKYAGGRKLSLWERKEKNNIYTKLKRNECRSFSEQPMFPGRIHGGKQVMDPELSMAKLTEALKEKDRFAFSVPSSGWGLKYAGEER
ncbi:hypothetical protein CEXT_203581 [Caerostris extrusa]|uniref:Uncharacterized protein n=1 Tax=Caerostris extrusa TaxID=172846 RepID=A0AAV4Q6G9_CAEEX|nr:hypothetical protein CEXT_203581 [Caerostris extrusa]